MKIDSEKQLREIYGESSERARDKVQIKLDKHCIHFINCSPFLVLSTCNASGNMDASPRGGEKGFVKITDDLKIVIPDFKGNNRVDSLSNIIETGSVGILFMIPGISETLRVNGSAQISNSADFLNMFSHESKSPITCIVIDVKEAFLHCAKAFIRSKLWNIESQIDPSNFPTMGTMLKDQLGTEGEPESREDMFKRYSKDL